MPGSVELSTPNLVHALMLTPPKGHRRSKSHVEVVKVFKSVYQSLGIKWRAVAFQRLDQDATRYVPFKGYVVWRFPGEISGERGSVIEDHRGVAVNRRHHLGHDDPLRVLLAQ